MSALERIGRAFLGRECPRLDSKRFWERHFREPAFAADVVQKQHTLSRRGRQRRALACTRVTEPLFPGERVVRPFLLLDAPGGWLWWQEELMTLLGGQTAGSSSLGNCHNFLGVGENCEQPRRFVLTCSYDPLAIRAKRRAPYSTRMARQRLADLLAALGIPQPHRFVLRRGDDALAVGAERRAPYSILMAPE